MPESVTVAEQGPEIVVLVERIRAGRPGLRVDVQSPTPDDRDDIAAVADYQEIVIAAAGPERYVIPLHDENEMFELWRVPVFDMLGAGELVDTHTDLGSAVAAALAAITVDQQAMEQPELRRGVERADSGWGPLPTVPAEIAGSSPQAHPLASQALHGGASLNRPVDDLTARRDRNDLRSAMGEMTDRMTSDLDDPSQSPLRVAMLEARESLEADDLDAALQHLTTADDLRRRYDDPQTTPAVAADPTDRAKETTAVSNVWRSDMTAATEVQAQVRKSAETGDDEPTTGPLREEEVALLKQIDPELAQSAQPAQPARQAQAARQAPVARQVGGRADWSHRRPERATAQTPGPQLGRQLGQQLGRSVDGSD